jgi:hypothetical protein
MRNLTEKMGNFITLGGGMSQKVTFGTLLGTTYQSVPGLKLPM